MINSVIRPVAYKLLKNIWSGPYYHIVDVTQNYTQLNIMSEEQTRKKKWKKKCLHYL